MKTECQLKLPFVMYADFEIVLVNQSGCAGTTEKSCKEKVQTSCPLWCYSLYIKSSDDCYFRGPEIFRGEDLVEEFFDAIMVATNEIQNILKKKVPMKQLTQQQEEDFNNSKKCHICESSFKSNEKRVKDHDQLTYEHRGPADNLGNLQHQINPHTVKILCIIHNPFHPQCCKTTTWGNNSHIGYYRKIY